MQLESQLRQQQIDNGKRVDKRPGEAAIAASLLLSVFETVLGTVHAAWYHHLKAATELVKMIGPEKCQHGFMRVLFRSVRIGSVSISPTSPYLRLMSTDELRSTLVLPSSVQVFSHRRIGVPSRLLVRRPR